MVRITVTVILLGLMYLIYWLFGEYDWGHPLAKLGCYSAFFLIVAGLHLVNFRSQPTRSALWAEILVIAVIFVTTFCVYVPRYAAGISQPPWVDIGYTTVNSAVMLIDARKNPYSSPNITPGSTIPPDYRGFHYGPVMMLAYLPGVYIFNGGFKIATLVYVLITAILLGLLVVEPKDPLPSRVASIAFVVTAFLLPEPFWKELLQQGANDIFPVMLVIAGLYAFKKDRHFLTGLLTGLSFAAKFSPAMFLIPFMPVRERRFWFGFGLGVVPILPFLAWDPVAFIKNVFWFRLVMDADVTSLYSVLPSGLTWILPMTTVIAFGATFYITLTRNLSFRSALTGFTLLLIVADVTQKEIHLNHLIWFAPLFAIIFAIGRENINGLVSGGIAAETEGV